MKLLKFFAEDWLRALLTALSLAVSIAEWSKFGFQGTSQMGSVAVIVYCLSFGFAGAMFGVLIAAIIGGINRLRGLKFVLEPLPINLAWGVLLIPAIAHFFKG